MRHSGKASGADPHLPAVPRRGMKFWVQWGDHYCLGRAYSIPRVSGRSFYVSVDGRSERHLLVEWRPWLGARLAEGKVFFAGALLRPPVAPVQTSSSEEASSTKTLDREAQGQRLLRAKHQVLRTYRLERLGEAAGVLSFAVRGGQQDYVVTVRPDWSAAPACTCPDAMAGTEGTARQYWCKHIVAVLLANQELRGQLMDVLL